METSIQYKAVNASGVVAAFPAILHGWSLRATGATVVNIRDGVDATGTIVAVVNFTGDGSSTESFSVVCNKGIYFQVVSGTIAAGSVLFE